MVSRTEHTDRSTCPLACALDIVGDHWTLLVIRDLLLLNRHEYKEFLEGDERISSNILSDRLAKLEQHGLLSSIPHPHSKKRKLYYLTSTGKDLVHVIIPLGQWAFTHLGDRVMIPAGRIEALKQDPNKLIESILKQTQEWEHEMGVNS